MKRTVNALFLSGIFAFAAPQAFAWTFKMETFFSSRMV